MATEVVFTTFAPSELLLARQGSSVRGAESATKFQADSGVESELQKGLGAVTHWVPPTTLRCLEICPANATILAQILALAMMPSYAAQMGSTLAGLRCTYAADLGSAG